MLHVVSDAEASPAPSKTLGSTDAGPPIVCQSSDRPSSVQKSPLQSSPKFGLAWSDEMNLRCIYQSYSAELIPDRSEHIAVPDSRSRTAFVYLVPTDRKLPCACTKRTISHTMFRHSVHSDEPVNLSSLCGTKPHCTISFATTCAAVQQPSKYHKRLPLRLLGRSGPLS